MMQLIREIEIDDVLYKIFYISKDRKKTDYIAYFIEREIVKRKFLFFKEYYFDSGVALINNKQPMLLNKKIETKYELPPIIQEFIFLDYRARTRLT